MIFFTKFLHVVQKIGEKGGLFRPAGGEIHLQVENCVSPVTLQDLRGERANQLCTPLKTVFACGSMVLFDLCFQKICTLCKFFGNKDSLFRPAAGESGRSSRQPPGLEPTA
jgi:hypothetical protein